MQKKQQKRKKLKQNTKKYSDSPKEVEKRDQYQRDKQKTTNKMVYLYPTLSVITLNVAV